MNKIVYMHEFDSSLFSKDEIDSLESSKIIEDRIVYAHKRLFDEVFLNDNIVVFTYNQITNSLAFLKLIDHESERKLQAITRLFKIGKLKITLSNNTGKTFTSISEAIQNEIKEKLINNTDDKEILIDFLNSLKSSSISPLDKNDEYLKRYDVDFLKKYILFINHISMNKDVNMSQGTDKLEKYINLSKSCMSQEYKNVIKKIEEIAEINDNNDCLDLNFRVNWYNQITKYVTDSELRNKCKRYIDACYNACLNDNINSITDRYDEIKSFDEKFMKLFKELINM